MVDWQSESDLDSIRNSCDVFDWLDWPNYTFLQLFSFTDVRIWIWSLSKLGHNNTQYKFNLFFFFLAKWLEKNIFGSAWDVDEHIKDAQEGKSYKEPKRASKFCHLGKSCQILMCLESIGK